jgi:hypothetical protein
MNLDKQNFTQFLLTAWRKCSSVSFEIGQGMYLKRWQWILLLFEMALFAFILVMPQIDLPDFTFHNGTGPVAAHDRVSPPPLRAVVQVVMPVLLPAGKAEIRRELLEILSAPSLDHRLSSLCTLLC